MSGDPADGMEGCSYSRGSGKETHIRPADKSTLLLKDGLDSKAELLVLWTGWKGSAAAGKGPGGGLGSSERDP